MIANKTDANRTVQQQQQPSSCAVLLLILLSCCWFAASATALATTDVSATKPTSRTTATTTTSTSSSPILYKSHDYHLLEIVPHSTNLFTQGLTTYKNYLYEGTGLEYKSQILQHDPSQNMKTVQSIQLEPNHLFGEGITYYYVDKDEEEEEEVLLENNNEGNGGGGGGGENAKKEKVVVREERMIQLTWKDGIGLIYRINDPSNDAAAAAADDDDADTDADTNSNSNGSNEKEDEDKKHPTLELIDKFSFDTHTTEGWGITFIPHTNEFYVSDGSEYIMVWDAETLKEKRRMAVTLDRGGGGGGGDSSSVRLKYLNELEFVDYFSTTSVKKKEMNDGEVRRRSDVTDWEIHDVYLEQCQEGDDNTGGGGGGNDQTTCTNPESSTTTEECNNSNDDNNIGFTSTMSILANVWYQDVLIRIDPVTAKVTRVYDLSDIYPYEQRQKDGADCLNGISVTTGSEGGGGGEEEEEGLELWVTGKLWPKMYRIRLID